MRHFKTFVAGLAAIALTAGAAVAQDSTSKDNMSAGAASSDSMSKDSMSSGSKMSKTDMATMKTCQGMAHDAMVADAKCKAFMAKHPDMFNADGTMKSPQ